MWVCSDFEWEFQVKGAFHKNNQTGNAEFPTLDLFKNAALASLSVLLWCLFHFPEMNRTLSCDVKINLIWNYLDELNFSLHNFDILFCNCPLYSATVDFKINQSDVIHVTLSASIYKV